MEQQMTRIATPSPPSAVIITATFQHGLVCQTRNDVFCDEEKTINTYPGESTKNVHFRKSCWNSTRLGFLLIPKNAYSLCLQVQTHESWLHH